MKFPFKKIHNAVYLGIGVAVIVFGSVALLHPAFAQQVPVSGGGTLNTGTNQQPTSVTPTPSNVPQNGGTLNPNSGTGQQPTSINSIPQIAPPINQPLFIPPAPLQGWLWSDMPDQSDVNKTCTNNNCGRGLGWVSLSSVSDGSTIPYGAVLNMNNGLITGHGWSEMGGWLSFQPTGTFPVGNSTFNGTARVDGQCLASTQTTCRLAGWARFVAGTDAQAPSWDGWVSMSGKTATGVDYGVSYNKQTGKFSGFAWGADVSGWIDFSRAETTITPLVLDTDNKCLDAQGNEITYPVGTPVPTACVTIINTPAPEEVINQDKCSNLPGVQSILPTFYNGSYYNDPGVKDKRCVAIPGDQIGCMNPNASNYNPNAIIDTVPSSCIIPGGPTTPGGTSPLDPIYKEN